MITPFSCGMEYAAWTAANCDECAKSQQEPREQAMCEIEVALERAYFDTGEISDEIAARMGCLGVYEPPERCGEMEPQR